MRWAGLALLFALTAEEVAGAQEFLRIETPTQVIAVNPAQIISSKIRLFGGMDRDVYVDFDSGVSADIRSAFSGDKAVDVSLVLCGDEVRGFAEIEMPIRLHVYFPDSEGSVERAETFNSTLESGRCES